MFGFVLPFLCIDTSSCCCWVNCSLQSQHKSSQGHGRDWQLLCQGWGQANFWKRFSFWYHFCLPQSPNSQPRLAPVPFSSVSLSASAPSRGWSSPVTAPHRAAPCTLMLFGAGCPAVTYNPLCPTSAWEGDLVHGWPWLLERRLRHAST